MRSSNSSDNLTFPRRSKSIKNSEKEDFKRLMSLKDMDNEETKKIYKRVTKKMLKKLKHLKRVRVIKRLEKDIDYADKVVFMSFLLLYLLVTGVLLGVIFN